ncbi:MAG: pyridoxal phosphate-dependent aminotransferase [Deltaproteobacteria bacterium]|nr:pyridoxal phosphate-dependent aminotransferase [Deltaproteobacteria bacterium]
MPRLSRLTDLINPSPTLTLDAQVKALKASGADIVNMGVGEPDFPTPDYIREAAIKAISEGFTRYTPSEGIIDLRQAVSDKLSKENGLDYKPNQIVVSNGGKHSLANIALALFQEGDEVIIPTPTWVTYPELIVLSGAKPIFVPTLEKDGYVLKPQALSQALSPRTKGLIINSPCNPTGMIYSKEDLLALVDLILKADLWVISDDIYESLIYDGAEFYNLPMVAPETLDRTVIVNGVSKKYSMTGWRIGYLAGPEALAKAVTKIQSQMTSNPNSVAQKAALAALTGPQESALEMVKTFGKRKKLVYEFLSTIPGVVCPEPKGAFYVFPDVSEHYGRTLGGVKINGSDDLALVLLQKSLVATVPGSGFMEDRAIRLSYAVSELDLERGLERIAKLLA